MGGLPLIPEQASVIASQIDFLTLWILALTIFFSVVIAVLITYFAIKYRRRREDEIPKQTVGGERLELVWTIVPLILALATFFWAAKLYVDMSVPPANAVEIYVVGKQWMWKVFHLDGQEEINTLTIPVGRPVKLIMTSEDVIHSFFIPAFRLKWDVLPGRYTEMFFEATKTGTFHLFCAEFCGTEHSGMIGSVTVLEPSDYELWLAGGSNATGSPASSGERVFNDLGCASCHRLQGGGPGPSLVGIYGQPVQLANGETVVADDAYMRESIVNPNAKVVQGFQPIMPSYQGRISEEQLLQVIAYIRSLGSQSGSGSGAQPGAPSLPGAPPALAQPTPPIGRR